MGDLQRTERDLYAFAAANDKRLYKLFQSMALPSIDIETLVKTHVRPYLSQ